MVIVFIAVFGLILGSFCNAAIWRIHTKRSMARERSVCESCGHELSALDLVPVLSWLALGGKCRYCRAPISIQNPIVELTLAVAFVLLYLHLMPLTTYGWLELLFWLIIATALMILAVYDLYWMLLPDVVLLPLIVLAVIWCVIASVAMHTWLPLTHSLLAAFLAGGSFYLLAAVSKGRWMGGGDIKLAFLMGLLLGLTLTGAAMVLAFYSAAIISLGLLATRLKKRSDHIPFGPFLIAATLISFVYGQQLIHFYLQITHLSSIL